MIESMLKTISSKYPLFPLFLLTLAAFLLRIMFISHKCFWADEGITWFIAAGEVTADAPASYKYLFGWGMKLFGWNEMAGRFSSVIAGTITVPIVYATGRDFFSRNIGLIAGIMAAVSPYLIPISQEMRIYSMLGLALALGLWCFLHILQDDKTSAWWWTGLLAAGIFGQYVHCFYIFVLFFFGVILLFRKSELRKYKIYLFALLGLAVFITYLPQLKQTLAITEKRPHLFADNIRYFAGNIYNTFRAYFSFMFGDYAVNLPGGAAAYLKTHRFHFAGLAGMCALWMVIVPYCAIKAFRRRGYSAVRAVLIMAAVFTILFLFFDVSTSRHLIFIFIPSIFIIAGYWDDLSGNRKKISFGLYLILCAVSLFDYYKEPYFRYERADFRSAGILLKEQVRPEDCVLIFRERNVYYTLKFYAGIVPGEVYYRPHRYSEVPSSGKDLLWWNERPLNKKVSDLLEKHQRVWLVETERNRWDEGEIGSGSQTARWDFGPELRVRLYIKAGL